MLQDKSSEKKSENEPSNGSERLYPKLSPEELKEWAAEALEAVNESKEYAEAPTAPTAPVPTPVEPVSPAECDAEGQPKL